MQQSLFPELELFSDAIFSPCRIYRYILWRGWLADWQTNYVMVVGLNPSTADETKNDPTIRRCIGFAKDWGYSGLCMANLFAYRATYPRDLFAAEEPVGFENDTYLTGYAAKAGLVLAAWGNHGLYRGRHSHVIALLPKLHYLVLTKKGMPGHPLYLSRKCKPLEFIQPAKTP